MANNFVSAQDVCIYQRGASSWDVSLKITKQESQVLVDFGSGIHKWHGHSGATIAKELNRVLGLMKAGNPIDSITHVIKRIEADFLRYAYRWPKSYWFSDLVALNDKPRELYESDGETLMDIQGAGYREQIVQAAKALELEALDPDTMIELFDVKYFLDEWSIPTPDAFLIGAYMGLHWASNTDVSTIQKLKKKYLDSLPPGNF